MSGRQVFAGRFRCGAAPPLRWVSQFARVLSKVAPTDTFLTELVGLRGSLASPRVREEWIPAQPVPLLPNEEGRQGHGRRIRCSKECWRTGGATECEMPMSALGVGPSRGAFYPPFSKGGRGDFFVLAPRLPPPIPPNPPLPRGGKRLGYWRPELTANADIAFEIGSSERRLRPIGQHPLTAIRG